MRTFAFLASIFAGLYLLCASDVTDLHPPSDVLKIVSFNAGDASDRSWLAQSPTVGAGATFPAGYRTADFDGTANAYVTYPDVSDLEAVPLTVIFWVRIDTTTPRMSLVSKSADTAAPSTYRGWYIHFCGTTSNGYDANCGILTATNNDGSNYRIAYTGSPSSYSDGSWHHVAVVIDAINSTTNWKIYRDGASVSFTPLSGGTVTTLDSTKPLALGGFTTPNQTARLNGALDDVRIYSRVLTANEIGAIYAEGIGAARP